MMDNTAGRRLHELFEEQVGRTPDATAVVAGPTRISYRDLNALANGVAARLSELGAGRGALVGVCLRRDANLIAAMLGVLKSGAAYVPLDPAYPAARLRLIAEDARLGHVVLDKDHHELAGTMASTSVLMSDVTPQEANREVAGATGDAAYVMYTSGSTGRPKGVVLEHRNAVNLMAWALSTYTAEELSGVLAAASVCFDFSVTEIFPALLSGGTVIVADNLLELPTLPARDEVTMISGPPSGLRTLLRRPLPAGIRTVNAGGEVLTASLVNQLLAQQGVQRIRNYYGPTECTTLTHCHDLTRTDTGLTEAPPIGRPVGGAVPVVLDASGRPVPEGGRGELWIGGPGVSRGYLRQPELTAQRFVDGRYRTGDLVRAVDGVYHYVGRADDQVKVRGFRVELGEVEQVLAGHPKVRGAVATAPADADGVRTLLAYAEADGVTETELRDYLVEQLPAYLVPSRIGLVDRIPLGPNGKADRAALPPLAAADAGTEYTAPRDDHEARVARIVADVLGVERVGVFDSFYDLGGHSLAAAAVIARLGEELGAAVPLAWFLTEPTVAALARRVAAGSPDVPVAVRHPGQPMFPVTGMQWNLWMTPQMWPGATNTVAIQLRVTGLPDATALRAAFDGVVRRHEVLRTVVAPKDETPVAVVRPPAPVPLTEVDLRDVPAEDLESRVAELAREAASHAFDLSAEVPLIRASLLWTGPAAAELIVVVDHFAFDGFSVGLLARELVAGTDAALAGRPDPSPEPALQMGDVAMFEWALSQRIPAQEMRAYWTAELAGANSPNLPGAVRTKGPALGRRYIRRFDDAWVAALAGLEADTGGTRYAVFASALGILLRRRTGEPENLIGVVTAFRDRPGVDRVIGPLVGMIPVRIRLGAPLSFREVVRQVTATTRNALANQDLGLMEIVACAGERHPGLPLTPVILSMQPADTPVRYESGPLRMELVGEIDSGSTISDMTVLVNETATGVEIQVMYDTERLAEHEVASFLDELVGVLADGVADPDASV